MQKIFYLFLILSCSIISAQQSYIDAKTIINDYIEKIGGEKKLKKIKTLKKIISTTIKDVPDFNMLNEVIYKEPDLYSSEITIDQIGQIELVKYDGQNCFIIRNHNNEKIQKPIEGLQLEEKKRDFAPFPILNLTNQNPTFELIDIIEIDNKPTYKIQVPINKKTLLLFFDQESKLLVKKKVLDVKTVKTTKYFDYKKIKGVMFPFKTVSTTEMNNKIIQQTTSETQEIIINLNVSINNFQ